MEEQSAQQTPGEQVPAPKPTKKQVPPIVVLLGLLVILGYVGWQYTVYFGMPKFGRAKPVGEVVMEKVRETKGDITKVSKDDMAHLNDITMGNGEKYYKTYARQYAQESRKAP